MTYGFVDIVSSTVVVDRSESYPAIVVSPWAQSPCTRDEMRHIAELASPVTARPHSGAHGGFCLLLPFRRQLSRCHTRECAPGGRKVVEDERGCLRFDRCSNTGALELSQK